MQLSTYCNFDPYDHYKSKSRCDRKSDLREPCWYSLRIIAGTTITTVAIEQVWDSKIFRFGISVYRISLSISYDTEIPKWRLGPRSSMRRPNSILSSWSEQLSHKCRARKNANSEFEAQAHIYLLLSSLFTEKEIDER